MESACTYRINHERKSDARIFYVCIQQKRRTCVSLSGISTKKNSNRKFAKLASYMETESFANYGDENVIHDYEAHINPSLAALMKFVGYDSVEIEARGCVIKD